MEAETGGMGVGGCDGTQARHAARASGVQLCGGVGVYAGDWGGEGVVLRDRI